jgi:hypothetical protein
MSARLDGLSCAYHVDDEIRLDDLPGEVATVLLRTAVGEELPAELRGRQARLAGLPAGTHVVELRAADGTLLEEELVSVRERAGEDPVLAFATSYDAETVPSTLRWLKRLRCTVVQIYDWMESYSRPLGPTGVYRDSVGREIDRRALQQLISGVHELRAVPQAYAPVIAADPNDHPDWRLVRNDGQTESLGDLLDIMDPGNRAWQREWLDRYGAAADALRFSGFHLDTYGYPRGAADARGHSVAMGDAYASFVEAVRAVRPYEVLSFNQVNGVPSGFRPPASPSFRYAEVWPPNDRWRHLEGLMSRSAGQASRHGDTLAIYPPVWGGDRAAGLRTAVLSEAIPAALGIGTLIWGDAAGALRHPYYVNHERLTPSEADTVIKWHRFALRCRDLFRCGQDTSWYELEDENAAVSVSSALPALPEPVEGALFTRVVHTADTAVVSVIDLSGSASGSWSDPTGPGSCTSAVISALLPKPERWRGHAAVLGRDGGRFVPIELTTSDHREGRAVTCELPIADGWSVLRLKYQKD